MEIGTEVDVSVAMSTEFAFFGKRGYTESSKEDIIQPLENIKFSLVDLATTSISYSTTAVLNLT